ncbi:MAG: hypothetical protein DSZ06_04085 [Sulfurospirillum sp.]|nr:MAG: hypothetical protein DSZ06_04085 [Sulfurospirillum sp.]
MQRIFLFVSIFLGLLHAQSNFSQTEFTIDSVKGDLITINTNQNFAKGASAVVLRKFDDQHEAIIANAVVIEGKNSKLILKLSPYNDLTQDVLPNYDIPPKAGDKVLLNHLYNRAMIIAPNQESYLKVRRDYSNFDWVHPDLFALKLVSSFHSKPTKEQFQEECKDDTIGLIFFVIKDKTYIVDCKSFKAISYSPITPATKKTKPFYSRLKETRGKLGGLFGGDKIDDFDRYYTKLLTGK